MLNDLVDDAAALKASALSYANDMLSCSYKVGECYRMEGRTQHGKAMDLPLARR